MFVLSWLLAPCAVLGLCQRFEESYYLHLQGWIESWNTGDCHSRSEGNKKTTLSGGPWKGPMIVLRHSLPSPLLCNLLKGSVLIRHVSPYSLSQIGPYPSASLLEILYKPSTFQICLFSPEGGNIIFFRNVGIDLWNRTAPNPKTTATRHKAVTVCCACFTKP
jgi:hypothetical protein